jgi:hypothetical protein
MMGTFGGAPDRRPIKVGEVWENPVTGERSVILERPWHNPASRVTGELTALVGARVMGEHRHPALVEQFTVLEGALSIFEIWWTRGDSNHRACPTRSGCSHAPVVKM